VIRLGRVNTILGVSVRGKEKRKETKKWGEPRGPEEPVWLKSPPVKAAETYNRGQEEKKKIIKRARKTRTQKINDQKLSRQEKRVRGRKTMKLKKQKAVKKLGSANRNLKNWLEKSVDSGKP